jgi:hypothetical protein
MLRLLATDSSVSSESAAQTLDLPLNIRKFCFFFSIHYSKLYTQMHSYVLSIINWGMIQDVGIHPTYQYAMRHIFK